MTHKFSNLTNDIALVNFFQVVLARREELDKEQNNTVGGVRTNVGANSVCIDRISQSGVSTLG